MLRILFFLLLPFILFAQSSNWNSIVDLNLSVNDDDRIDLYTNKDGNHILVENGSTLKYYLYSYSGSQVRSYTIDGSISSTFSKITGWEGTIYISFKEGSTIYTKKSTNAGQSWSGIYNISIGTTNSDGLELWTDSNGLHIVYSAYENGYYETKYKLSQHAQSNWINSKTVTDESGKYGGMPSVTTSSGRVHVAYCTELEDSYTRDKYSGTWQTSQSITTYYAARNTVITTSGKLHSLYSEIHIPLVYLMYKNRNLSSTTWSSATQIDGNSGFAEHSKPEMAVTANDKMHMAYYSGGDLTYREWDSSLSGTYDVMDLYEAPRISANCNDVYVIGITEDGSSGYEIKMRQRDVAPLTPTGFSGSWDNGNEETGHPRLDWNANNEADLKEYEVWKKVDAYGGSNIEPWAKNTSTTNTYYIDSGEIGWDYMASPRVVYYKIRAVDQTSNYSDYTSAKDFYCNNGPHVDSFEGDLAEIKIPNDCQLIGNFPNPFNPSTTIHYFMPEAQSITITVYDVIGKKVQTLYSGNQESGFHSATFNGANLPSGIYYYNMTAGQFSEAKRMLLVK